MSVRQRKHLKSKYMYGAVRFENQCTNNLNQLYLFSFKWYEFPPADYIMTGKTCSWIFDFEVFLCIHHLRF